MTTDVSGPRRVLPGSRRVCLPTRITDQLRWDKGGCMVRVTVATGRQGELLIQRARGAARTPADRDPGRARRLDAQGQVTLPAPLMAQVGLSDQHPWVYFAADPTARGIRVIPACLVRVDVRTATS